MQKLEQVYKPVIIQYNASKILRMTKINFIVVYEENLNFTSYKFSLQLQTFHKQDIYE